MPNYIIRRTAMRLTGKIILLIGLSTTLILTLIFGILTAHYNKQIENTLLDNARILYKMVLTVRHWASDYGGVLVKKGPGTQINPFLPHPYVVTQKNDTLVLRNPALITRELSQLSKKMIGDAFFHMASKKYLNPANKPDAFENKALSYFETHKGKKEFYGFERRNNHLYFRYFAPLYTERSCLSCHAKQGYKEGDLRGGVSIHISAEGFKKAQQENKFFMLISLLGTIFILSTLLYFGLRKTIIRPIESLTTAAEQLEAQNYAFHLAVPRKASVEISKLFSAFLRMRDSILSSLSLVKISENKYRSLIENSPEAIGITDLQGKIIEINRRLLDLVETGKDDILGKTIQDLIDPKHIHYLSDPIVSKATTRHYETYLIHRKGEKIPVEIFEIHDIRLTPQEQITFFYMRDLRLRKKLEQYSIQMEKMLVLGELSAGIAHELRNPLFALANNLDYLNNELKSHTTFQEIYPELQTSLNQIHKIVSAILDYASPHKPEFKHVDLLDIINKCLILVRKKFEKASINIRQEFHGSCFVILADPYQIEQVFINLFMNAFKAMHDHGELKIQGTCKNAFVEIRITDNGIGMTAEQMKRIFNPFYTQFESGTGLGLSIVQKIMDQHHARITVKSAKNEGTTFTLVFPQEQTKEIHV